MCTKLALFTRFTPVLAPEDVGTIIVQNAGSYIPSGTALHPRGSVSSATPLWEHHTLKFISFMKTKHSEVPNALLTVLHSSVTCKYIKYKAEVPQRHYSHKECNQATDFPCMHWRESSTVVGCEASMLINELNYILLLQYKLLLLEYHTNNTKSVKL